MNPKSCQKLFQNKKVGLLSKVVGGKGNSRTGKVMKTLKERETC